MLTKSTMVCGLVAAAAMMTSCESSLSPEKAAQRLQRSPITSVFSHNDMNSPRFRDCYEVGPLPERAERALITWLHNSTVREFSYAYPQYYLTTTNVKGGGEVVWGLCSDGHGNLVGVLVPANKHTAAWTLPTIDTFRMYVCETSERKALSDAIMESLADAGYDKVRLNARMAKGMLDKNHLISKPLNEEEQKQLERERKERAKALEAAKKQAKADSANFSDKSDSSDEDSSSSLDDDDELTTSSDDDSSSDDSSLDDDSSSSDDSGDDSSSDDSGDEDLDD